MNDFDYVTDSNPAKCTAGIKTAEKKITKFLFTIMSTVNIGII